jgi:hypothetical protein
VTALTLGKTTWHGYGKSDERRSPVTNGAKNHPKAAALDRALLRFGLAVGHAHKSARALLASRAKPYLRSRRFGMIFKAKYNYSLFWGLSRSFCSLFRSDKRSSFCNPSWGG